MDLLSLYNPVHSIMRFRGLFYGFIQGHDYLDYETLESIRQLVGKIHPEELIEIEDHFSGLIGDGQMVSFATGRMGFYALMKVLSIGDSDEVILPGHTCSVMPNAVWRAGARPIFADIDPDTFGSSPSAIKKRITSRTKMIVAQHSFGIPCKIDEIVEIGKKQNIFILEDSAISLGSSLNKVCVGNWGDAALFSTDHSKPLNTLIGGFIYTRNNKLYKKLGKYCEGLPHLTKSHQKRLFDMLLFERKYYNPRKYGLGKIINFINQKMSMNSNSYTFLENDYSKNLSNENTSYPYPAKLPFFLALLGVYELERWGSEKELRKNFLYSLIKLSEELGIKQYLPAAYFDSRFEIVPLRFVFTHPNSVVIRKKMSKFVDVNWFWFQKPIICSNDLEELGYEYGTCSISELVCKEVINWPCTLDHKYNDNILNLFKWVFR